MTRIYSEYHVRRLDNDRFVQMLAPFTAESDELAKYLIRLCKKEGRDPTAVEKSGRFTIPAIFVQDEESVPFLRGRNQRGGGVHDYFSCNDSVPVVPKDVAAAIYLEINAYCDSIDAGRNYLIHVKDFFRRWSKWSVVYVWPGYFHKRSVFATPAEIAGVECDPYVTAEKLDAAIVESKEATAAIKAVPDEVEKKPEMVEASEKVTADLKEAKERVGE